MTETEFNAFIRKSIPNVRVEYWYGIGYYKVIDTLNGGDWDIGEVVARAFDLGLVTPNLLEEFVSAVKSQRSDLSGYPSIHYRDDVLGLYLT